VLQPGSTSQEELKLEMQIGGLSLERVFEADRIACGLTVMLKIHIRSTAG
jgi:hypothetical protein